MTHPGDAPQPARFGPADLGSPTEPQPAVPPAPMDAEQTRGVVRGVAKVLLVRGLLAVLAAAALVVGAVFLYRAGMRTDTFPAYADNTTASYITRYSAPWLAGAAGVVLLAGLSLTAGLTDLVRRTRLRVLTK